MFISSRALRRIFGTRQEEVMEGWRKAYNEELHKLYCSANIVLRRMHVSGVEGIRNRCKIWAQNPDGRGSLGRQSRLNDRIEIILKEV